MAGKKEPGKFTIKFNVMDPAHRQVIDMLEPMGRTKAQFIANAVLHTSTVHRRRISHSRRRPTIRRLRRLSAGF